MKFIQNRGNRNVFFMLSKKESGLFIFLDYILFDVIFALKQNKNFLQFFLKENKATL